MSFMADSMARSAVLISPCILSPGLQAERRPGEHWGYPFVEALVRHGLDVFPLPCPESSFGGFQSGLRRGKHGIDYYMSLDGYQEHCAHLAQRCAEQLADMCAGGIQFVCMLGIEHSPTCAASYMYSRRGTLKRRGMFFELLHHELESRGLDIPQIGINRTHPGKALAFLEQMLLDLF